jgi:hypothetical protein
MTNTYINNHNLTKKKETTVGKTKTNRINDNVKKPAKINLKQQYKQQNWV